MTSAFALYGIMHEGIVIESPAFCVTLGQALLYRRLDVPHGHAEPAIGALGSCEYPRFLLRTAFFQSRQRQACQSREKSHILAECPIWLVHVETFGMRD